MSVSPVVLFAFLSVSAMATPKSPWKALIRDNFASREIQTNLWKIVPDESANITFEPHGNGEAIHIRSTQGNIGIETRRGVTPPYRLLFDFMQPANEAGGYRIVITQTSPNGNAWWFEFDRESLAVWTTLNGGWATRWRAGGMHPDTWYHVEVDDRPRQVRFKISDPNGVIVAESDWIPHDDDPMGGKPIDFEADSGGGLRGALFSNISIWAPNDAPPHGNADSLDTPLLAAMRTATLNPRYIQVKTRDGLSMTIRGDGNISRIRLAGKDVSPRGDIRYGGFYAWDITQPMEYHRFTATEAPSQKAGLRLTCKSLGLALNARFQATSDRVNITGELSDLTGKDRAIVLVYAIPVDVKGWRWGDDLNHSRLISYTGVYQHVLPYGAAGKNGRHLISPYPWGCVTSPDRGLLICRPMDWPRLNAFWYALAPDQRFLGMRVELGLSKLTRKFPSRASFRFVISSIPESEWGFRAATKRYYQLFPQFFVKRVKREGIWHLWMSTKISRPQDFGMVFHEQEPFSEDRIRFDEEHGGYTFTYAEPSTIWQQTKAYSVSGTFEPNRFLAECRKRSEQPLSVTTTYPFTQPKPIPDAIIAKAVLNSYVGRSGEMTSFHNSPPDRIAVNCCADPELKQPSRASLWFDYEGTPALTDKRVSGAYIDTVGWSYFDAAEDFRKSHWATTEIPLVPSFQYKAPAELAGFSQYELYAAISHAMHIRGKLTLANTFPFSQGFYAHLFDVLGAGESGNFRDFSNPDTLSYCRALAYRKPVSVMFYAFTNLKTPIAAKERAMQRLLIYGVWPGSGNGTVNDLNAIRSLYKKYIPIFRAIAQAGWRPIPDAYVKPSGILLERYGGANGKTIYLDVRNAGLHAIMTKITLTKDIPIAPSATTAIDLVTNEKYALKGRTLIVPLGAGRTKVLKIPLRTR